MRAPRQRTLKQARIFYGNRAITTDVLVRDISPGGCRLKRINSETIPDRFEIQMLVGGLYAQCTVRWRRGQEIGVAFEEPPQKRTNATDQVVFQASPPLRSITRR